MTEPQDLDQRAMEWLNERWQGQKTCPVCRNNKWQLGGLVELRPYTGGSLVIGGGVFPVLQVICENCGNTLLFNALVAGLLPPGASA